MNTHTRRTFLALIGVGLTSSGMVSAQDHSGHGESEHAESTPAAATCTVPAGTPQVTPVTSDIPFDRAYIDTMIPHHESVIDLATAALDQLEDERLITIATAILDAQPGEIEQLTSFREEWYGSAEPDEPTHDMMMVTMAGLTTCGTEDHMDLMNGEWLVQEFDSADNKDLRFIDLVIPHHEMAVVQSQAGLQLAEREELITLCQEVIEAQEAEIAALQAIRANIA